MKLKKQWATEKTALQKFDRAFLRHTGKLNEFKVTLDTRFQVLQDLLEEEKNCYRKHQGIDYRGTNFNLPEGSGPQEASS
ncbi:unnamed protein product [Schistosoma margrebowiei]|uniref:Uncharacterized protein n=1 Tax=Schistosoma margrebowiei TaxID=48269 RepID=A0A183LC16_9TREM|nr:unnamed protein product [Schistosoma margrebowiei]